MCQHCARCATLSRRLQPITVTHNVCVCRNAWTSSYTGGGQRRRSVIYSQLQYSTHWEVLMCTDAVDGQGQRRQHQIAAQAEHVASRAVTNRFWQQILQQSGFGIASVPQPCSSAWMRFATAVCPALRHKPGDFHTYTHTAHTHAHTCTAPPPGTGMRTLRPTPGSARCRWCPHAGPSAQGGHSHIRSACLQAGAPIGRCTQLCLWTWLWQLEQQALGRQKHCPPLGEGCVHMLQLGNCFMLLTREQPLQVTNRRKGTRTHTKPTGPC